MVDILHYVISCWQNTLRPLIIDSYLVVIVFSVIAMTGLMCQMPLTFQTGALCAAVQPDIAQCHLVKSTGGKYFYKLPKSRLAGKFQMCSLDKPEKAVRNRWCLSPVLWGFMHPLRVTFKRERAFFMEGTLDLPAHPVMVKF